MSIKLFEDLASKLINLSGNYLLNLRSTSNFYYQIPFLSQEEFLSKLLTHKKFLLAGLPDSSTQTSSEKVNYISDNVELEDSHVLINNSLSPYKSNSKSLYLPIPENIFNRRLNTLYKRCQSYSREKGLDTFYITIGTLKWNQDRGGKKIFYNSPILILQANIIQLNDSYYVQLEKSFDFELNPILFSVLHKLFGYEKPTLDIEFDCNINLKTLVTNCISNLPKDWSITNECYLGCIASPGIPLEELDPDTYSESFSDKLEQNLLTHEGGTKLSEKYDLDDPQFNTEIPSSILPSDSSQLSAIMDVKKGKDLVIQGPPGTGKSQTIVNIIAQCLKDNKKVLFLAQKSAALQVVNERLKEVGLDHRILDLFPPNNHKSSLFKSIGDKLLKITNSTNTSNYDSELYKYQSLQSNLNNYKEFLLTPLEGIPFSFYELSALYLNLNLNTSINPIHLPEVNLTIDEYKKLQSILDQIEKLPDLDYSKFTWFKATNVTLFESKDISHNVKQAEDSLNYINNYETFDEITSHLNTLKESIVMHNKLQDLQALLSNYHLTTKDLKSLEYLNSLDISKANKLLWIFNSNFRNFRSLYLSKTRRKISVNEAKSLKNILNEFLNISTTLNKRNFNLTQFIDQFSKLNHQYKVLTTALNNLSPFIEVSNNIPEIKYRIKLLNNNISHLNSIAHFNNIISSIPLDLKSSFDYQTLINSLDTFKTTLLSSLFEQWLKIYLEKYTFPNLPTLQESFKETNKNLHDLYLSYIKSLKPDLTNLNGSKSAKVSEKENLSIIEHVVNRPNSRITLRQFIQNALPALQKLFPCFFMTPSTVADLLPKNKLFDIVIIDEASQMLVQEAAGSLLRSKQWVVVGDSMQMPPSTLMQSYIEEPDEDTKNESILDRVVLTIKNQRMLQYHYRSEHDSLIQFSNTKFYNDSLYCLPSHITSDDYGIKPFYVEGVYTPKSRQPNIIEATAVLEDLKEYIKLYPERSVGIVTMNRSQTDFMEDLFRELLSKHQYIRDYVDKWNNTSQYFFIKNLENVQGDERDTIYISTVHGKNKNGIVSQNLGINKVGDEKRINVLITRAKKQIRLFTSLKPADITTSAEGPQILKSYLDYAFSGQIFNTIVNNKFDSPWEEWFYNKLVQDGFIVQPQVGVSSWRVDLGIKHEKYPYGYLCGIELDGASFHSAPSARDRDALRQSVLESKGWTIFRVWSTNFFNNPEQEYEFLKTKILKTLETKINEKEII